MSKILIIEDDASVTKLLSTVLEKKDFDVLIAHDILKGTTLAQTEKPDLILLDLVLSEGRGVTVIKNLKMSTCTDNIPIIVISGTDDVSRIAEVSSLGITNFIRKPFDINDVIAKIQEVL